MTAFAVPTRTVADVMTSVKRKFGDESGVQLEDTDIIAWINDAQYAIVTKNRILKAKATTPVVANQAGYDFAAIQPPIHQIESVLVDGRRVDNMSMAQAEESIASADPDMAERGFPRFWYEWAGELTFWPIPTEGTILLRYSAAPSAVTQSSDLLSVPNHYFSQVVDYVLKQAYELDENESMMQTKGQEFEAALTERGEEERTAQTMTYGTITVYDFFE